jgi:hypothetical protein
MHNLKSLITTIAGLRARLAEIARNANEPETGSWLLDRISEIEAKIRNLDFNALDEDVLSEFSEELKDIDTDIRVQFANVQIRPVVDEDDEPVPMHTPESRLLAQDVDDEDGEELMPRDFQPRYVPQLMEDRPRLRRGYCR